MKVSFNSGIDVETMELTSSSTPLPWIHSENDPSCTDAQCPAPKDHQDWGPSTSSIWTAGLIEINDHHHNRHQYNKFPTLWDCQRRRPLVSKDIQTDWTIGVNVGVVYLSGKADFGRLERIIGGEGDRKEENTARIGRVTLIHIA